MNLKFIWRLKIKLAFVADGISHACFRLFSRRSNEREPRNREAIGENWGLASRISSWRKKKNGALRPRSLSKRACLNFYSFLKLKNAFVYDNLKEVTSTESNAKIADFKFLMLQYTFCSPPFQLYALLKVIPLK